MNSIRRRAERKMLQDENAGLLLALKEMANRLVLTDAERAILKGRDDGCIRVNDARPILKRIGIDI